MISPMKTHSTKFWSLLALLTLLCCTSVFAQPNATEKIEQWGVYEVSFKGPSAGNPYLDVSLGAEFKHGSHSVTVPGFYDGNGIYRIRFSPDRPGQWTYVTRSERAELRGRTGSFLCIAPTGNNHGPVRVVNTHYLAYADGSPFYAVGTTAYQWTSVKQSIQEQTLKTLATSSFNKIRMCVFPKHYNYGNNTEPWVLPFRKKENANDPSQPNYDFFQNFDKRVKQLMEMGIQADVILFHPYDRWGYFQMGKQMNERYVRYMIARLSAYRNVWWSLANEWDVPRIKEAIDWEGIGTLLQREDPHQRLRGIHNWYHDESHFYDHSRPWITHVSAQTYFFFNAIKWRNKYQKPLLYDEMRYEGDVPSNWGNMNAKEMTSYFWKAGLSGGYGTHGDTFKNDSDTETEVRWWAKGGTLMGESPKRIAFFRKIMEEAPVTQMTPHLVRLTDAAVPDQIPDKSDGKLIETLNNSIYTFSKEGEYYLSYTTDSGRTIKLNLAGKQDYTLQVIDTWNMKIVSEETVRPGKFEFETKIPFTALRLISKARMADSTRPRVVVLSDFPPLDVIAGGGGDGPAEKRSDPDDVQSMVRFLVYANEFDVEGLVASAATLANIARKQHILDILDLYDKVYENLRKHDSRFPPADKLRSVTWQGRDNTWGKPTDEIIGEGRDSEASEAIIKVVDRPDPRPVWVCVWGGSADLAQAIWKVQKTRSRAEFDRFISKLRVFMIGLGNKTGQDGSGQWMLDNFPNLFVIVSQKTYGGMFAQKTPIGNLEWLNANVREGHGPLGAVYPRSGFNPNNLGMKEGDTPSFMYLYSAVRGMNDPEKPDQESWGGQYVQRDPAKKHWYDGPGASSVSKWLPDMQKDFATRMDWCVTRP